MSAKLTPEQKEANKNLRRFNKAQQAENDKISQQKNQKPVKSITISIEWKRSRTWGSNPHAMAEVRYHDGSFERKSGYTASGYGYDKESTVIAEIFNEFMRYKLWIFETDPISFELYKKMLPYGIGLSNYVNSSGVNVDHRSYSGGIGTSCYYDISKFIGGIFEKIAWGRTFDVYRYTDN